MEERAAAIALLRQQERALELLQQQRSAAAAEASAADAAGPAPAPGDSDADPQEQQQEPGNGSDLLFLDLYMRSKRSITLSVPEVLQEQEGRAPTVRFDLLQQQQAQGAAVAAVPGAAAASALPAGAAVMEVGGIVWAASILLAQHVLDRSLGLRSLRAVGQPVRVLELGCGNALVPGMAAAMALAQSGGSADVIATDLGAVVSAAQETLRAHQGLLSEWGVRAEMPAPTVGLEPEPEPESALAPGANGPCTTIRCDAWDWTCFPATTADGYDCVLAADVLYHESSIPALLRTLRAVITEGRTLALIAYQHRNRAREERVWQQLRDWGFQVTDCVPFPSTAARSDGSTVDVFSEEQRKFMRLVEVRLLHPLAVIDESTPAAATAPAAESAVAEPQDDGIFL